MYKTGLPGTSCNYRHHKCRRQPRSRLTFPHKLFVRFLLSHERGPRDRAPNLCLNTLKVIIIYGITNTKLLVSDNEKEERTQWLANAAALGIPQICAIASWLKDHGHREI